jgi:hypothetical protein
LQIRGAYLHFEEWDIRWREYQANNRTGRALTVLVEHPRTAHYTLFDTAGPKERTDEHLRFEVQIAARGETKLRVQERRLIRRREELQRQSYDGLRRYLRQGLLAQAPYNRVAEILALWEKIGDHKKQIEQLKQARQAIYKGQDQIQGNMGALGTTGKEGALRARYVEQLEESENRLKDLARQESDLKAEIERIEAEIAARIEALG